MKPVIMLLSLILLIAFAGCTRSPNEPGPEPVDVWHIVIMSEIVSNNVSICTDEHGDFDDYVEIYNSQDTAVDISGFALTDDPDTLKYIFPNFTLIQPDTVLLIWCDAEPEQGDFHADFRISAGGEWIALFEPGGGIVDSVTVPELPADSAYIQDSVSWLIGAPSPQRP
ncbi:lamin tail domain-containing protein [bacterium]|nr:lamin tail domain-containing protein [bacterium]